MKANIPIIGIAPNYVKAGALYSLTADYTDIGDQTGRMCVKILNGTTPDKIPVESPMNPLVTYNPKVAEQLNIQIPPEILGKAKAVSN